MRLALDARGQDSGRQGACSRIGPQLEIPLRTFQPVIVKKRQRRLNGVDEIVLSLYANGLTTGEISAHFAQLYGLSVSKETISRIMDKVIEEMQTWQSRPLNEGQFLLVVANPEQGETSGQIRTEQDAGSGQASLFRVDTGGIVGV